MTAITRGGRDMGFWERERGGRKQGVSFVILASAMLAVLSLPFFRWINIVGADALYESLKLRDNVIETLRESYSVFNLLSFVQNTKTGILGLFAMALLLLLTASLLLHAMAAYRAFAGGKREKRWLRFYSVAQAAMLLSVIAAVGTLGFVAFANHQLGMTGFAAAWPVFLTLLIGCVGYGIVKRMESQERIREHEHGFLVELRRNWILFLFLVPCFIFFLINNYLPMVGAYFAFTQFNFRDGLFASPFVGLNNFQFLVNVDLFRLTRNTVLYNLAFIAIGNVLQVFFAILISRVRLKWFKRTSQTMIFMPYFVSFVILRVLVYNIFAYDFGLINAYITAAGGARIDFYNMPGYWPLLISLFYLWKNLGYGMVIYLATIMGINDEYYDAAKVDGANVYQQIRYVTLPHLKPTFIILLLYALGGIMRGQLELFYQMVGNNGVLYDITDIIDTYVYRILLTQPLSMGMGAAAGLYQSVFGFAIIMLTNAIVKRSNADYALF